MSRAGIVVQAFLSAAACFVLVLFGYPRLGVALSTGVALAGSLIWLVNRKAHRTPGESWGARLLPLSFLLLAGAPWLGVWIGQGDPKWWADEAATVLAIAVLGSAIFLVMFLSSSLVDQYYVLPRLRGGAGKRPCTDSLDPYWRRIAQIWLLHRLVAAVVLVGATTAIVALAANHWLLGLNQVVAAALAAVAATVLAGFYLARLPFAVAIMVNPPLQVGDKVRLAEAFPQPEACPDYYVSSVSLEGVTLIELTDGDCRTRPAGDRMLDPVDVHKLLRVRDAFIACSPGECKRVNPHCGKVCGVEAAEAEALS